MKFRVKRECCVSCFLCRSYNICFPNIAIVFINSHLPFETIAIKNEKQTLFDKIKQYDLRKLGDCGSNSDKPYAET